MIFNHNNQPYATIGHWLLSSQDFCPCGTKLSTTRANQYNIEHSVTVAHTLYRVVFRIKLNDA